MIGQPNFTSFGFGTSDGTFDSPVGVAADATSLYISDSYNYRVLIYQQP